MRAKHTGHVWRFFRSGGVDQVRLETGADLLALESLDQKLWTALACPVSGLHFDMQTLSLIDTDHDGRIRASELLAAVRWTTGLLRSPERLMAGNAFIDSEAVFDTPPEGAAIHRALQELLKSLGKDTQGRLTLEEIIKLRKRFNEEPFNGDGIITAASAVDPALKLALEDICRCTGSPIDSSGASGVDAAGLDAFFDEARAFCAWMDEVAAEPSWLPLKERTAEAYGAFSDIQQKTDDFFARCAVSAFDDRAQASLAGLDSNFVAMSTKDLTMDSAEIRALPLAPVGAGKVLPLVRGMNPGWAKETKALLAQVVVPLLGMQECLTEAQWITIVARMLPYRQWLERKQGATVEQLGIDRVRALLAPTVREQLSTLLAQDLTQAGTAAAYADLEKLIRFNRDIVRLCCNFVNMKDFYAPQSRAIFQIGTLFLDQRSCEFCLRVEDQAKHAAMAALSGAYLAYCDCSRVGSGKKMQIVAAFTDGDSDNLMVGRNGVFYDREGNDWDATITRIIDNPISLRQAFWSPYKNLVRMIEQMVARRAATANTATHGTLEQTATIVVTADKAKQAEMKKVDIGTVAALGVAVGAIGTFFATALGYFSGIAKMGPLAILGALVAVLLLISGPSMILAYIKLRMRNLGPILDGNGWAINARARISVPLGASLTHLAKLPPGAQRDLVDPFAEKRSRWIPVAVLVVLLYVAYRICDSLGFIHEWTHGRIGKAPSLTSEPVRVPPGRPMPTQPPVSLP